jgi:hypothetical protein
MTVQRAGAARMFGWTGLKYRTEVNVEIHAILAFFPEVKDLVKNTLHVG